MPSLCWTGTRRRLDGRHACDRCARGGAERPMRRADHRELLAPWSRQSRPRRLQEMESTLLVWKCSWGKAGLRKTNGKRFWRRRAMCPFIFWAPFGALAGKPPETGLSVRGACRVWCGGARTCGWPVSLQPLLRRLRGSRLSSRPCRSAGTGQSPASLDTQETDRSRSRS